MRTDHSTLTWLMGFKNIEEQIAHLIQCLQKHNFTSEHRQGRKHYDANSLPDGHAEKSAKAEAKQVQATEAVAAG
jgi:hypothetical protein